LLSIAFSAPPVPLLGTLPFKADGQTGTLHKFLGVLSTAAGTAGIVTNIGVRMTSKIPGCFRLTSQSGPETGAGSPVQKLWNIFCEGG